MTGVAAGNQKEELWATGSPTAARAWEGNSQPHEHFLSSTGSLVQVCKSRTSQGNVQTKNFQSEGLFMREKPGCGVGAVQRYQAFNGGVGRLADVYLPIILLFLDCL